MRQGSTDQLVAEVRMLREFLRPVVWLAWIILCVGGAALIGLVAHGFGL